MWPARDKAAMRAGARPLHRQQHRAAPLAADPDALDEAQHRQDHGAPDADLVVGRHKGDQEGGDPHQQEGGDQRRFAPDAVAVMAEDRRPDRPRDKADGIDREGLQRAGERIGSREIELRENQPGDRAVDEEIVPLDRRADGAGNHRPAQLRAMLQYGQSIRRAIGGRHCCVPPRGSALCRRAAPILVRKTIIGSRDFARRSYRAGRSFPWRRKRSWMMLCHSRTPCPALCRVPTSFFAAREPGQSPAR